ncbi:hypothetical protein TCAL_00632 [Tigriopus californicus]|uniref:Transmembrane protein 230 n=1 Tax=Tigriopus californicus TaxID=6832 RepID=A0A553PC70_TIGCA|nr:transmembrane protein 230-like [Tigriopus californicus]TRY75259.1 hypothetical protein TCAL_00632 [Tigriopus californicus]|eukprot:TCALIF_00632-PA protein Name:"Similar to TMEM230 Transmembrane protein 230 (Bos taurus)" AED:0.04 eAED:0.04 QI:359/1/1/1/1/1/2/120/148
MDLRQRRGGPRSSPGIDTQSPDRPAPPSGARSRKTTNPDFDPSQFESNIPVEIPWKAVALGAFLLLCGLVAFIILTLDLCHSLSGHAIEFIMRKNDQGVEEEVDFRSERFWPLAILGFLAFTPGSYVTFLFVMAALQIPGYSFDDIPN